MERENPIHDAWRYIHSVDWQTHGFDIKKAYLCALFSELTYYRIPDFELKDADRVSVIPCFAYQRAVREGRTANFEELLRSLDFGQFFVVVRRYAIVVGVRTPNVIIVAIRGTKYLYDWVVNLKASKHLVKDRYHFGPVSEFGFHRGFFKAVFACLEPVSREIQLLQHGKHDETPIYVTGHSLGGALAAIMHAIWSKEYQRVSLSLGSFSHLTETSASYTFGMPRYGDIQVVTQCATPYHLYNELDVVPTVPPKWLGFENCFSEYKLDGTSFEKAQGRESLDFAIWLIRLLSGSGIANHAMETYRERIHAAL